MHPIVLIVYGLMIIIGVAILSIPSILTFRLFRKLRTKGKSKNRIGIAIFSITTLTMLLLAVNMIKSNFGFGPEYDKEEIKQKIGGILICNSVYDADIHNWYYRVSYEYKPNNNDSVIKIGSGTYCNREWNKDEQMVQYKNWTILKTGGWFAMTNS